MALTRDVRQSIRARLGCDPTFRRDLPRDYINATVGFYGTRRSNADPSKSLMRMFGRRSLTGKSRKRSRS